MKHQDPRIETVRQNLRLAIALRDTSAARLSTKAGLSVNMVNYFLKQNGNISHANMLRLCDVLRVPIGIMHIPGAITPGRLELQNTLEGLSEDQLAALLANLPQPRQQAQTATPPKT